MRTQLFPFRVIASAAGAKLLEEVVSFTGSLSIDPGTSTRVVLPSLEEITGHIDIGKPLESGGCPELVELEFPRLRRVGGQFVVMGTQLTVLRLPELTEAHFCVDVTSNPALSAIELPRLKSIGASLIVQENPQLQRLEVPALEQVGVGVQLDDNPMLPEAVWKPLLERFGRGPSYWTR